ncbi:MgtC/SapB family protein [Alkaliphilus hydrothermalis]|uniref:Mg2+ transporter-C (MgtC) family protein n=1 Tax=Alkaliphilus hydrothermalis TaxID=1482730 RepID=A0ABS2NR24_9FIRM|nr:MgtC/SapB family protein [Alkaliphilus hydrothermalis]MBM7615242.1 putative Mg2+ transporter-C (MgtC) family protein [Alkaliphilus hydrothermalis]
MLSTTQILLRLISATVLGGLVGLERESIRRAAGFRTHILVCSGSTLVMLISIFMFETHRHYTTLDPARLGAQVISGIGFLGAGTIIKDGGGIKGLTTAASLWGIACIGLALGAGFYTGAYITTAIVLIALKIFPRVERMIPDKRNLFTLQLDLDNKPGQIGRVADVLGENLISIIEISLDLDSEDSELGVLTLECKGIKPFQQEDLLYIMSKVDGVNGVRIV